MEGGRWKTFPVASFYVLRYAKRMLLSAPRRSYINWQEESNASMATSCTQNTPEPKKFLISIDVLSSKWNKRHSGVALDLCR
jgi:hypothetical protein